MHLYWTHFCGKALFLGLCNIALFCSGGVGTCVNAHCAEIKMHLLEVILFVCSCSSCLDVKLPVSGRREVCCLDVKLPVSGRREVCLAVYDYWGSSGSMLCVCV